MSAFSAFQKIQRDQMSKAFSETTSPCSQSSTLTLHWSSNRRTAWAQSSNMAHPDFFDPEDLRLFQDGLLAQAMDMTSSASPSGPHSDSLTVPPPPDGRSRSNGGPHHTDRDPEKLLRPHGDRDQALQAVAHHTQPPDRDKPCSPLKPTLASS
ncbi:hypothetical protein NDU88_008820 [Pleurodeles waltl]|uniref:Uncharacterized protein n=1 Tax=Pleurodeles waltl TaxID=8319 RepID=A0AAV7P4N0_PLEWA|nr:hypothetical protein NDU88_008820 [Pleurodeles waltl]